MIERYKLYCLFVFDYNICEVGSVWIMMFFSYLVENGDWVFCLGFEVDFGKCTLVKC